MNYLGFMSVLIQHNTGYVYLIYILHCLSQWPRGLRHRSAAARLLRLWVRIPPEAWMFVCCECRVLSGRGLCVGLITRPEESYRLWRVVVCDLETSRMGRPWPAGTVAPQKNNISLHWHMIIMHLLLSEFWVSD